MMQDFISYIASKIFRFRHQMEWRRVTNILRNNDSQNQKLIRLYKEYLNEVISGKIFPKSKAGYKSIFSSNYLNIFKAYKKVNPENLTEKEEEYLIQLLNGRISKWFIPYFLREFEPNSTKLMNQLMEAGIKELDPSFNSCFLSVAERIYGSRVNDYLFKRFKNSDMNTKRGIFRALYWLEPKFTEKQKKMKIEIFLNEYQSTKNKRLKTFLSWNLPDALVQYPDELKENAKQFLEDLHRRK